ncbi:hypothetical protein ABZS88_06120 [Streptomyces sp. NPDC005480]|uniref:hypothetical protein n=1 Tax=Streptomyces sp. NPDC005480 TaxID=3154880 RepID=UPI0033BCE439
MRGVAAGAATPPAPFRNRPSPPPERAAPVSPVLGPMPPTFDAGIEAARTLPREATAVLAYDSHLTLGLLPGLAAAHRRVPRTSVRPRPTT